MTPSPTHGGLGQQTRPNRRREAMRRRRPFTVACVARSARPHPGGALSRTGFHGVRDSTESGAEQSLRETRPGSGETPSICEPPVSLATEPFLRW